MVPVGAAVLKRRMVVEETLTLPEQQPVPAPSCKLEIVLPSSNVPGTAPAPSSTNAPETVPVPPSSNNISQNARFLLPSLVNKIRHYLMDDVKIGLYLPLPLNLTFSFEG